MDNRLIIRNIKQEDCETISNAFRLQGWNKTKEQYERYLKEHLEGKRDVIIAEYDNNFAGYVTIQWRSNYKPFQDSNIPEVVDLNVLIKVRKKGIGTALLDEAEKRVAAINNKIGIGVGLMPDYGSAQRLYIKRGYIPDGLGACKDGKFLVYGDKVIVDDNVAIYLVKQV
ncbi:MAG: GNAT family N-acetyltransferase [Epulopiscium sp.]|nr:GNAT family N-acetyltransferase [Candidatus Epulonipiscium sp.]